jgi:hypothetical protein
LGAGRFQAEAAVRGVPLRSADSGCLLRGIDLVRARQPAVEGNPGNGGKSGTALEED